MVHISLEALNYLGVSSDYRFDGKSANWTLVVRFDENTISIRLFMRITKIVQHVNHVNVDTGEGVLFITSVMLYPKLLTLQ